MFVRIPFSPIRESLYSPQELMAGPDAADFRSFARARRFQMLRVLHAPRSHRSERSPLQHL